MLVLKKTFTLPVLTKVNFDYNNNNNNNTIYLQKVTLRVLHEIYITNSLCKAARSKLNDLVLLIINKKPIMTFILQRIFHYTISSKKNLTSVTI